MNIEFINNLPLRFKLTLSTSLVVFIVTVLGFSLVLYNNLGMMKQGMINEARLISRTVSNYSVSDLVFGDAGAAKDTLEGLRDSPHIISANLFATDGKLFASLDEEIDKIPLPAKPEPYYEARKGVIEITHPVYHQGKVYGHLYLAFSTEHIETSIIEHIFIAVTVLITLLLFAFLLANRLQSIIYRPINNLINMALKITSETDLSIRVKKESEDELGTLTDAFNTMLDKVSLHEAALRESEKHYRDLVESSNTIPWEMELQTMLFTYVGPQAEKMLGYPAEQWYAENFWPEHIHPEDRDWALVFCHQETQKLHNHDFEYRFIAKDGKVVWLRDIVNVIAEHGTPIKLSGFMLDITKRKEAELELQRYRDHLEELVLERTENMQAAMQETERASKLKSQFLGRMSHELRTPLNAILGFGQLLEEEKLSCDQSDSVKEIMHASRHLLGLIDEVLDLTRIETGNLSLSMEGINIKELTHDCVTMVLPLTRKLNIRIDNFITDDDLYVLADRLRLKEVLINLLTNAIKYNQANGRVTLNGVMTDDNRFRFQVSDSGPGISAGDLDGLFEPFNRMGAEYSDIEGTGIGLTISKQLMELMGGAIGCESVVGRGSVFWIDCPVEGETRPVIPGPEAMHSGGIQDQVKTLLYIEDNPANLRLIEKVIERNPSIRMLSAPNAEMGIELARQKRPDLILMDLNLPGMDGYEALSRLRNYPETRDITVVALSAAAMPRDIERGILAGFKRYLTKPVQLNDLREVLRLELGEQRQTGEG